MEQKSESQIAQSQSQVIEVEKCFVKNEKESQVVQLESGKPIKKLSEF